MNVVKTRIEPLFCSSSVLSQVNQSLAVCQLCPGSVDFPFRSNHYSDCWIRVPFRRSHFSSAFFDLEIKCREESYWSQLTVNHDTKDIELDDPSKKAETKNNNNPGLSLTLFLQALKSTLHFSAVTSLKSQKLGIEIKTRWVIFSIISFEQKFREWSGNSDMYENHFQFKSEEKKLPVVKLDNCQILSVYLRTIQRSVVTWLVDHLQGREHVSPPSPTQIAPIDELTSISLDSGFLSDSKDELEASESFSPPTKQLKFNEKPSVRTLLTSPVVNWRNIQP